MITSSTLWKSWAPPTARKQLRSRCVAASCSFEDTTHLSQLDDSSPHRDCNCLSTIASAKFLHDVFDVNLDSLFGDEESFCDVAIPVTARDMFQDIDLSVFAFYSRRGGSEWRSHSIQLVTLESDSIAVMTSFVTRVLFAVFDLPEILP